MSPSGNTLLSFVIVALGFIGIILSFLVPDRKKSFISICLAGVIVVVGLFQFASQSIGELRYRRRIANLRGQNSVDLDKLREDFKRRASETTAPVSKPADKK